MLFGAQGRLAEAKAAYGKAIDCYPKFGMPHFNLAVVLHDEGRLKETRDELRKAVDLGYAHAAPFVARCEREMALRERIPGIAAKQDHPTSQVERLELAELCLEGFVRRYARLLASTPKPSPPTRNRGQSAWHLANNLSL